MIVRFQIGERGVWWLAGWLTAKWSVYWEVFPTAGRIF
jgi:hypothetical protein